MSTERLYLYGVVPGGSPVDYGAIGIGAGRVATWGEGPAAMIAGPVGPADLSPASPEAALLGLAAHQRVLERVMADATVIPLKYGTVARDEHQVAAILHAGGQKLADALRTYAGKVEMDVSVFWSDLSPVLAAVGEEPLVRSMKQALGASGQAVTVEQRVQLGQAVKAALDRRRAGEAEELLAELRTRWNELLVNSTRDETQVLHAAVLIGRDEQDAFDELLELLSARAEGRLRFRRVGPLPAYSFATIEVESAGPDALARAADVLELGETASLAEVKSAYRRLVRANHPDRSSDADAAEKVRRVTAACELLERYATNYRHAFSGVADGVSLVHIRSLRDLQTDSAAAPAA